MRRTRTSCCAPGPCTSSTQANERLRAQDEDNAQHPEQENERLRIQAEIEPDYTVAARPEQFPKLGQSTAVAVAATEPERGVLCERETGSTAAAHRGFFAAERQNHYISKKDGLDKSSNAADAPTGNTLNEPEQRAFTTGLRPHAFGTKSIDLALPGNTLNEPEQCALTTGPRMHAYGTKSINLAACSRAKVKVGPLARIRIANNYITTLLAAAFGNISHAVEVAYGAERKDTHEEPNGARFGNISHAAEVSYGAELENAVRAVLYGAVAHDVPLE